MFVYNDFDNFNDDFEEDNSLLPNVILFSCS